MNDFKRSHPGSNYSRFRWSLISGFFVVTVLMTLTYFVNLPLLISIDSILITVFLFVIAILNGVKRYGNRNMLVFFLLTFLVSFSFENLSVRTGFPFGFYNYSPSLGILKVPMIIVFAYFAMGYLSWMIAHILTGQYSKKLSGKQIFIIPFVASFIMVMWDLTIDPISSTLQQLWVWKTPGAYFGVPVANFAGWFLVVYIFFQLFALYISKYDTIDPGKEDGKFNKMYWTESPVVYGIMALGTILSVFYRYNEITQSMALITIFTMGFVTLLALLMVRDKQV
jgi:uncharacterized membrane protein